MYKNVSQKFTDSCFLLVRKKEDSVIFLGTAFVIHEEGYVLTASHLLEEDYESLMAVRPNSPEGFTPLSMDTVPAIPLEMVKIDPINNTAVLRFTKRITIETPDHLVGSADSILLGNSVLCLGFPFGHQDLHNLAVQSSTISSKVSLRKNTKLFLIDATLHEGMAGGPLVNYDDGRVIGILTGRFLPDEEGGDFVRGNHPDFETSFSYAVSIEYGKKLLEEIGLKLT